MSDIKTIEQLDETSAQELTDSDLLMTSVRNINGSYTSKKMTLSALADYVNSRESGDVTGFGGYEIYDLSNSDANYINGEEVGNDGFTKRFTRDCEILVTPSPVPTQQGSYGNITF